MAKLLRAWLLILLATLSVPALGAAPGNDAASSLPLITAAELPPEARDTLRLIRQGGPYPYDRDGVVFGNRERILPQHARGYYHEYTVRTPGVHNRGPRRIVCGPLPECYYSGDHYRSFKQIRD